MAKEKNTSGRGRTRNFATVVYPESAPENWLEILGSQMVPAFVSPLHDKDINPTGEPKKPHYHVILVFEGPKSDAQVQAIFDLIGGVGLERINSLRGYARYLCHLDNPEKAQYDSETVISLCGADYFGVCSLVTDKYKAISEMIDFCACHDIVSYAELLEFCRLNHFDWFRVLCDNGTIVMKEYLKSRMWTNNSKN